MANPTILIIEDDAIFAKSLEQEFTAQGYKVILAGTGKLGLQAATESNPDIVLLDVLIPDMTGWDVMKALVSDEKTKNIPVVVDSNLYSSAREMEFLQMGALEYVVKSNTDPEGMVKIVAGHLKKSKSK